MARGTTKLYTIAEECLDLIRFIKQPGLIVCSYVPELAFKLYSAPKSLQLRALVEDWDVARLVEELY